MSKTILDAIERMEIGTNTFEDDQCIVAYVNRVEAKNQKLREIAAPAAECFDHTALRNAQIREALLLMNSIIEQADGHTEISRSVVAAAFKAIDAGELETESNVQKVNIANTAAILDKNIADTVFKYIDRMNDVDPVDPADKIVAEFVAAAMPHIDARIDCYRLSTTLVEPAIPNPKYQISAFVAPRAALPIKRTTHPLPHEIRGPNNEIYYRCRCCGTEDALHWFRGTSCPVCGKASCAEKLEAEYQSGLSSGGNG